MTSLAHFEKVAGVIELPHQAVIDGRLQPAISGRTFDNVTPRNGSVINRVAECDAADVDAAVAAARRAFEDGRWRNLHYREKKRILFALADLMERDSETLAVLESLDVGKPIKDALKIDIPGSIRTLRYYAEALDKVYGEVGPGTTDRFSFAVHEPLGVIGAIVPWNFPLLMAMWKVAPALAMGNSMVLKPAEQSPLTALKLGQLALEAGLPPGVLNVVPGFGATAGKALALHMDVDMIAFTGSGAVGKLLMQYSGQSNLKRVSLELGGKSPADRLRRLPGSQCRGLQCSVGHLLQPGRGLHRCLAPPRARHHCGRRSSTSCSRSPSASCRATRLSPRPASAPWSQPSRCRRRCATSKAPSATAPRSASAASARVSTAAASTSSRPCSTTSRPTRPWHVKRCSARSSRSRASRM